MASVTLYVEDVEVVEAVKLSLHLDKVRCRNPYTKVPQVPRSMEGG